MNRASALLALTTAVLLSGCESSGGGSGYSSSNVYYGYGHSWYDEPNYWYDDPDYVVVDPPRPDQPIRPGARPENPIANVPGEPGAVRPEQPIARPPQPVGPELSASESAYRSRMPASQPRMSRPSSRPSIPNRSRGGGFRGGGGRRR
jgi:hypothetical protein